MKTNSVIKNDKGQFWSWAMRIWTNTETVIYGFPEIELQMAKRSDPSARIITGEAK